jgi:pimeloyl-ACP methyl ester carboxylesterase
MNTFSRRGLMAGAASVALVSNAFAQTGAPTAGPDGGRILEVAGSRLWFADRGQGPAVLILHGGLGHSGWMQNLVTALEPTRRVITIDTRGMGRSTLGPEPLSYERQAQDARAVLAALGVTQYDLLGFSDGGIVGYRLASAANSGLRRLVTWGSRWSAENGRGMWAAFDGWNARSLSEGQFKFIVDDYNRLNPDRDFDRMMRQAATMWKDDGPNGHPNAAIERIAQPTLVMVGDRDPFLGVPDARAARGRIKNAELLVVPNGTHPIHNERPDLVLPAITRFLAA